MASSSGRLNVAPIPRSTVRRDSFSFERNISAAPLCDSHWLFECHALFKRRAVDDGHDDGRETIVGLRRVANDGAYGRHVVRLQSAAEAVNHQLLDNRLHKHAGL